MSLNCCGLTNRLQYPEFVELVQDNDFVCLSESKTDDFDVIDINGYNFILKNRKSNSRVKSGGLAFGFKENFEKYISYIETDSKMVQWVKISSKLFGTDEDVIIGNNYIPPENSLYKIPDAFSEFECEFLKLSVNYKYILLAGDFNSRTASDLDFRELSDSHHDNSDNIVFNCVNFFFNQSNMSRLRCSQDASKNSYGNSLLEICKNNDLSILNGRVNGDKDGMFTCRRCSVVDYFICTYSFLCNVEHLQVLDFSTLYSDVHSPLSLCTLFSISETAYEKDSGKECVNVKKIRKWDSEKEQQFIDTIDKIN